MLNKSERYLLMKEYAEVYGQVLIHAEAIRQGTDGAEGLHAAAVLKLDVLERVTRYLGFSPEDYSKAKLAAKWYAKGWNYVHYLEEYTSKERRHWKPLDELVAMTKKGTYDELVRILYSASNLAERDDVEGIVTQLDEIDSGYGVY